MLYGAYSVDFIRISLISLIKVIFCIGIIFQSTG